MRGLAGIGFAIGSPCGSALVGTYLEPGRMRSLAFAFMAGCPSKDSRGLDCLGLTIAGAVGAGIGWILGGVFQEVGRRASAVSRSDPANDSFGWRILPIVVSVPVIYAVIVGVFVVPPDRAHPRDQRVDWIGAFTITATQLCLMLALTLSVSQPQKWKAPCEGTDRSIVLTDARRPDIGRRVSCPLLPVRLAADLPRQAGGRACATSAHAPASLLRRQRPAHPDIHLGRIHLDQRGRERNPAYQSTQDDTKSA